jgi:transcriptional antiterminator NusG
MSSKFYAVHVMPGRENKAKDMLLNRAVAYKAWQDTIFDILVPTEKEFVTVRGKRKIVDKKVFPGYIFVKMFLDEISEKVVQGTDGVSGFVRSGKKPVPMEDSEIQKILNILEKSKDETPKSNFKTNDIILIVSGPFSEFQAKIESVDEAKGRIKAYVNIFGRDTLTELDIKDVQLNV